MAYLKQLKTLVESITLSLMLVLGIVFSLSGCEQEQAAQTKQSEQAKQTAQPEQKKIYSPYVEKTPPSVERTDSQAKLADGVYWGDTHLHTNYSTDSGMLGNTLDPEQAYRYAKGEEVTSAAGMRTRLIRPLDFLVVADHAENLGLAPMIDESNPELLKNEFGKKSTIW